MKAKVVSVKRFAVHDGGGIRTTLFLKGCPLKCVWCHNPESISFAPEVAFYEEKCVNCFACSKVCPSGAHQEKEGKHIFLREKCSGCGVCELVCPGDALTFYGKSMTVDEVLPLLLEDRAFYEESGGGVTLSGGECLMYPEFCRELLKKLKAEGIHTAVDTCGFVTKKTLDRVLPFVDLFLYDIKPIDRDVHKKCTGVENDIILENLKYLDTLGKEIEVRIPFVPELNKGEMEKIANSLKPLQNIKRVRILKYHNYAGSKYRALSMKNTLPEQLPSEEEVKEAGRFFVKNEENEMKSFITTFLEKYNVPEEGQKAVLSAYEILKSHARFLSLLDSFYEREDNLKDFLVSLNAVGEETKIANYTVNFVFYLCLAPKMKEEYEKKGIDAQIYEDTLEDLTYKQKECLDTEGIWGIVPADWFYFLFHLRTFALGRLQYVLNEYDGEETKVAGKTVKKGDKIVRIHIPSSGKAFDKEARYASYEKAYHFFKKEFLGKEPLFACDSWLLNPKNEEILGGDSNIVSFMKDFKIVFSYEYPGKENLWRIFGKKAELPPEELPRETRMQRAFADWLLKGNKLGAAEGLFYFDPERKETVK